MARKDDIFLSFIEHPLIEEKYGLKNKDLPKNLEDGLLAEDAIIKTIALIVKNSEGNSAVNDKSLNTLVRQYLNEEAI